MPKTPHTSGTHRLRQRLFVRVTTLVERDVDDRLATAQPDARAAQLSEPRQRHVVALAQRDEPLDVRLLAADDDVAARLAEEREVVARVQRRQVEIAADARAEADLGQGDGEAAVR